MQFEDLLDEVNTVVERFLDGAQEASAQALGLDGRSFWGTAFVTPEVLALRVYEHDRALQYYGGFQYVDAEHRKVLGDWVFYSVESNRVREHLSHVFPELAEHEDFED